MKAAIITEEQIKTIKDALEGYEHNVGNDFHGGKCIEALAIVKSLKVQEPVAWTNKTANYFELSDQSTVYGSHTIPLYAGEQP